MTDSGHDDVSRRLAAPRDVLDVWRSFDDFPMETLTKAWVYERGGPRQRTVEDMETQRARFGASGNCFDLAIWLRQRLQDAGIESWFVGHDITNKDAHVAVAAADGDGRLYLCDLGDLWLQPVAVEPTIDIPLRGFFPGADITTRQEGGAFVVDYMRFGGKTSTQKYDLSAIPADVFSEAAERNQANLAQLLVEVRDAPNLAHWEYQNGVARWSRHTGLSEEQVDGTTPGAAIIAERSGMDVAYVAECLEAFSVHTKPRSRPEAG